jgi:hypothetical protein
VKVPADGGHVVVAQVHGRPVVRVLTLSADGAVLRAVDLPYSPERQPDQIVILPTGRLVVLGKTGAACGWTVLERSGATFRPVSATPADHQFQCGSHASGTGVIRDQLTGVAYLRQDYPDKNALYRLDDNGDRGPATRVLQDMGAVLPMDAGSDPRLIAVLGGALHYEAPSAAGPMIVRYDLATGQLARTDLRAASRRLSDAGTVYGLMLDGATMRVAVMAPRTGSTEVRPVSRD